MSEKNKEILVSLFQTVFSRISDKYSTEANQTIGKIVSMAANNGISVQSGVVIGQMIDSLNLNIKNLGIELISELSLIFKSTKRRDADFFWNILEPKIIQSINSKGAQIPNYLRPYLKGSSAAQNNTVMPYLYLPYLQNLIKENKLISKFQLTSTAEDRHFHDIPDVAIMCWFPKQSDFSAEATLCRERIQVIKDVITEVSKGKAVTKTFDAPTVNPNQTITTSVEDWLRKSALVICDLTEENFNVFYEYGYAKACFTTTLGICTDKQLISLPFHLKSHSLLPYFDLENLRVVLKPRVEATLVDCDFIGDLLTT